MPARTLSSKTFTRIWTETNSDIQPLCAAFPLWVRSCMEKIQELGPKSWKMRCCPLCDFVLPPNLGLVFNFSLRNHSQGAAGTVYSLAAPVVLLCKAEKWIFSLKREFLELEFAPSFTGTQYIKSRKWENSIISGLFRLSLWFAFKINLFLFTTQWWKHLPLKMN